MEAAVNQRELLNHQLKDLLKTPKNNSADPINYSTAPCSTGFATL
jgi:hypothetical protein